MRALLVVPLFIVGCGSPTTGSSDGGGDAGPAGWKHGLVLLSSSTRGRATAAFADAPDGMPPVIALSQTAGPCRFVGWSSLGGAGTATARSAGTLTLDGAKVPVMLTPSGATYPPFQSPMPLWSGGETLTLSATGAEVPAFTAHATAPGRVTVTQPAAGALIIPRSSPLAVAWSNGGAGEIRLTLNANPSPGLQGAELDCRFPASSATGSVPAGALALLPAGGAMLQIVAGAPLELQAGDYAVEVALISDAGYPGATVTLQ